LGNLSEFAVNGSLIPEVDFDVGQSFAGLLPINGTDDPNQLFFWFFPSTNPEPKEEILIWLTGGVSILVRSSTWVFLDIDLLLARMFLDRGTSARKRTCSMASWRLQTCQKQMELAPLDERGVG
jgi:hypothetical protein